MRPESVLTLVKEGRRNNHEYVEIWHIAGVCFRTARILQNSGLIFDFEGNLCLI